jgi:hypothetical protein
VETFRLILTIISGVCWTLVYIEGIRIGFRDKSYAIPFYALALNLAWESLHTVLGFRRGVDTQTIFNTVWFAFDIGILYTYFKFGRKYFPFKSKPIFVGWSVLGLLIAFVIEYAFVREFGVAAGASYSAFLQNLVMSILFIAMFVRRRSSEGQSIFLAVNKWIGTLAPTILYGIIGEGGFPQGSFLIAVLGLSCTVFDLIYIRLLIKPPAPTDF